MTRAAVYLFNLAAMLVEAVILAVVCVIASNP